MDLIAEIKISKNVISLLGALYTESGTRLTNMCVQHENKVCVRSLAYVCAAGGHLAQEMCFIDIIWGAPMKHGKAGASLEACKIQEF